MIFLLDTHILLWAALFAGNAADQLPAEAVRLIGDPGNEVWFSAASIWEVTIKHGLRQPGFMPDPHLLRRSLLNSGYVDLPITSDHALAVGQLPRLHKDPFDRLLIAQATVEGVTLLTSDTAVAAYPGPIRRV